MTLRVTVLGSALAAALLALLVATSAFAQTPGPGFEPGGGWGPGGMMGRFGFGISMLLFWALVIGGIVLLVVRVLERNRSPVGPSRQGSGGYDADT